MFHGCTLQLLLVSQTKGKFKQLNRVYLKKRFKPESAEKRHSNYSEPLLQH
jgi:hypothetical protein